MKNNIGKALKTTMGVIRQYPLVIITASIATFFILKQINYDYTGSDELRNARELERELNDRLISIFLLGISFFYFINIAVQRYNLNRFFSLLGVPILLLVYYFIGGPFDDFVHGLKFFIIAVISHLMVSYIGFFRDEDEAGFWEFNKKLFVNIVLTVIFTVVLLGGVMLAIAGMDNLFDLDFGSKIYQNVYAIIMILGSVMIFLHFGKDGIESMKEPAPYPVVLKFFVQYILIPLLFIYSVILYAYMAKIIIQWELPRGWVSYLVTAYGSFGILALLLVHPLKDVTERSWVRIFSDIFYYSVLPLVVLMAVGIYTRLQEYGVTEARYYVVLLTFWIFFMALYFILIKNAKIKYIPISLSIILLFSIILPGINAFALGINSQTNRFGTIILDNNLLKDGTIDYEIEIGSNKVDELNSIINYLKKRDKLDNIAAYFLASDMDDLNNKYGGLTSKFINRVENSDRNILRISRSNMRVTTDDFNSLHKDIIYDTRYFDFIVPEINTNNSHKLVFENYNISMNPNYMTGDGELSFIVIINKPGGEEEIIDIHPMIEDYIQSLILEDIKIVEEIRFDFVTEAINFTLFLNDLHYNSTISHDSISTRYYSYEGLLMGKMKR